MPENSTQDTQKKNKKGRGLVIFLKIFTCTVLGIIAFLISVRIGEKLAFAPFYNSAEREFATPGVNSGFVGQGLDYVEEKGVFLACGYSSKKGEASMVYVIGADGKAYKTDLKKSDGSNYTAHTGGIAHSGKYCYITGDDGCDVFLLDEILSGSQAKEMGVITSPKGHDPAFAVIQGDMLYEGSFYRAGNYETPQNERITTPCGDNNTAIIYAYKLDENSPFGVNNTPVAAYSTTGLVQGMTFAGGEMVLSTSYGVAPSHLKYYDLSAAQKERKTIGDNTLDLYYLDGSCQTRDVTAPPMTEEIVYRNGRIYIMCESASNKYIFGKLMSGRYIYSFA